MIISLRPASGDKNIGIKFVSLKTPQVSFQTLQNKHKADPTCCPFSLLYNTLSYYGSTQYNLTSLAPYFLQN